MFGKILGKSKSESAHKEIVEKVSKMNITDMRAYANNKLKEFEISGEGLAEIMKRLISEDPKTSKRYIQDDDMDSKIKKAFDLFLTIGSNKKVTIKTIELMQQFTEIYADIIVKYDKEHRDIYKSRFKACIENAIENVEKKADYSKKMNFLKS